MIDIRGSRSGDEYDAARELRAKIESDWPEISASNSRIVIFAGAFCYGQNVEELDLLIFGNFPKGIQVRAGDRAVSMKNLCLVIEVKDHRPNQVQFEGNRTFVRYREDWHDASDQNHRQVNSVRNYLKRNGIAKPPFIVGMLWLRNVRRSDLPTRDHNLIASDSSWNDILGYCILKLQRHESDTEVMSTGSPVGLSTAIKVFESRLEPSRLDRKRMEMITRSVLDDEKEFSRRLGEQMLIYRGRGGTGKTVRLLQIAHDMYDQRDDRVIILTYNVALSADIGRLLSLMRINRGVASRSIEIRTAHSFFGSLLRELGVIDDDAEDEAFYDEYSKYKQEALELLRGGALSEADIRDLFRKPEFSWDFVLVDEAQDWPWDERDLLLNLYGYRRLVIADGIDQLVRGQRHTDWRASMTDRATQSQIVTLRKVLRLKRGLCMFVRDVAAELDHELNVEPHDTMVGGRVIVLQGDYLADSSVHSELVAHNRNDGNELVDMLVCVAPNLATRKGKDRSHRSAMETLRSWQYSVWDGTTNERKSYPDLKQIRLLQYDSCRGLEGWIVVALEIDSFYDYKIKTFETSEEEQRELFISTQEAATRAAAQWTLIPLTRAIDTLVINVRNDDHPLAKVLRSVAERHPETVDWRVL